MTDDEIKSIKPPEGVLAEQALKDPVHEADAAPGGTQDPVRAPLDAVSPTILPVDPNYREPVTLKKFEEMAAAIQRDLAKYDDAERTMKERGTLIGFLIERIKVLESAALPFASAAMMMSNSRMCLVAAGRAEEPAGGIWMNNLSSTNLQANEALFFNAVDADGRQRTHDHIMEVFQKMQAAGKLQKEKAEHIEAGGKVH